jgi:hypothetical protein
MAPTALFVIDIQAELARASTEIPHAKRIRDAGEAILAKASASIESRCLGCPAPGKSDRGKGRPSVENACHELSGE